MNKEAMKLALEALDHNLLFTSLMPGYDGRVIEKAYKEINKVLAEPVKIAHKHEWFRTGEMKVGQMRCISCGTWGQEETPQRTWVGLTDEEITDIWAESSPYYHEDDFARAIEAKLKEKNT